MYNQKIIDLERLKLELQENIKVLEMSFKETESELLKDQENESLVAKDLNESKDFLSSNRKLLNSLKNKLAVLQDENIGKLRTLENLRKNAEEIKAQKKSSKESKLRITIEEEAFGIESLHAENIKISEDIKRFEENSKTTSIGTFGDESTNHEEEDLKEILSKIQDQQADISSLKFQLENKNSQFQNRQCKCLVF